MRRFLVFGFLVLSGCISEYVREPKTYIKIAFPEDGAYVPDSFKMVVLGVKTGKKKIREEVYGFPYGPYYKKRVKPEKCDSFEVLLKINGRDFKTLKGCDSLVDTVSITGFKGDTKISAIIKGTKLKDEKVYRVKSPYFYTFKVDSVKGEGTNYDWGKVGAEWEGEKQYLYIYSEGKKEAIDSGYISIHPTDGYVVGTVRDSSVIRIWWIEGKAFKIGEIPPDPYSPTDYTVIACDSGVGVIQFNKRKIFVFSRSGLVSERGFEGLRYSGNGCIDGYPYIVGLRNDKILLVGKDDKRLKAPGDSVEEYAQFSIFGLSDRLVLVITEYKRQYIRFFDGENWLKSYLPVIPVFDGCKYSRGGITFIGCIPIPFKETGGECDFHYPDLRSHSKGFLEGYGSSARIIKVIF